MRREQAPIAPAYQEARRSISSGPCAASTLRQVLCMLGPGRMRNCVVNRFPSLPHFDRIMACPWFESKMSSLTNPRGEEAQAIINPVLQQKLLLAVVASSAYLDLYQRSLAAAAAAHTPPVPGHCHTAALTRRSHKILEKKIHTDPSSDTVAKLAAQRTYYSSLPSDDKALCVHSAPRSLLSQQCACITIPTRSKPPQRPAC